MILTDIVTSIKSALKIQSATIDNAVFRLHYRLTAFFLVSSALLVSATQYFGDPIDCLIHSGLVEKVIDTFCWTHYTYSVVEAFDQDVGTAVAYPGVTNSKKHGAVQETVHHTYYQWVWFILFFQGGLFYLPRYLWKVWEGGRMKILSSGLTYSSLSGGDKASNKKLIVDYLTQHAQLHNVFVFKYIFCEFANFVNVIGQIYLLDAFLGGEFRKFGSKVLDYALSEDPRRSDPMIRIFPRMTKCKFHMYGASGDVEKIDAFCILPLNIINEKIFVFAWFWFVILATLTGLALVYRIVTVVSPTMRAYCLKAHCTLADDECVDAASRNLPLGDWFMLYLLTKNIEPIYMREIMKDIQYLAVGNSSPNVQNVHDASTFRAEKISSLSKANLIDDEISYV